MQVARVLGQRRAAAGVGPTVRDTNTATLGNRKRAQRPAPSEWCEEGTPYPEQNSLCVWDWTLSFELLSHSLVGQPTPETCCPAYHAQGGQPTHQQPEEVEEGMEVDVIGDGNRMMQSEEADL